MPNYYTCKIGNFDESQDILDECIGKSIYQLHDSYPFPSAMSDIKQGDFILLCYCSQIVAYGVALEPVLLLAHSENDGWNRIIKVKEWHLKNKADRFSGVHSYGISDATLKGGQCSAVKHVEESWAREKLACFDASEPSLSCELVSVRNNIILSEIWKLPLVIPDYQRSYSWRRLQILEFMNTLLDWHNIKKDKEFYLGTLVFKIKDGRYNIIDGQQRLLTLSILLFLCGHTDGLPLLDSSIDGSSNESYTARKHILWARNTISDWLKEQHDKTKNFKDFLLQYVQFCIVIIPEAESDSLAYTFFNAMNSAGKKLSDYDLLKAHHLRHISNRSKIFHAATRWDYYDENEHRKILSHTLYRLRRWIRSEAPLNSPEESRQLFRHFSARPSCGIEIFYPDNEVRFNSTIRGGSIFFHYAEHYRAIMKEYQSTEGYKLLGHLYGHSGNVLHDAIESIHFLYYCKFQNNYLEDALFCIAHCVSQLRNESQIRRLYIEKPVFGNCVKELDAAVSPDQFFDWALSPENIYVPSQEGNTRKAYWQALSDLYKEISEYPLLTVSSHVKEKMELLKTN